MAISLRKSAKKALLRLMGLGITPDIAVQYMCDLMGIEYEKQKEPEQGAFISRFLNGSSGASCISIDFDNREEKRTEISEKATFEILELFEEFNIPATWAICGATAITEKEAFEAILNSRVQHDIAVHTFDHVDFSSPECSDELARSQIQKTIELLPSAAKHKTFIFPWNREGHFDLLRSEGFIAYRGKKKKLGYPSKKHDLWDIQPVFYLSDRNYDQEDLLKAFVDVAIARRSVFHLWFHPWNLEAGGDVSKFLNRTIRPLLQYLDLKRKAGELWVCTLSDLANYCESRSRCSVSYDEAHMDSMVVSIERKPPDLRFDKAQPLTIAVRIPGKARILKAKIDGAQVGEDTLLFGRANQDHRFFCANIFFDTPLKRFRVDFS